MSNNSPRTSIRDFHTPREITPELEAALQVSEKVGNMDLFTHLADDLLGSSASAVDIDETNLRFFS